MPNLISSPHLVYQIYLRKWGAFGGSSMGNDIYYLKEFVDLCIQDFGEDNVVEMLKNDNSPNSRNYNRIAENWKSVKIKMKRLDVWLNKAKGYFDKVEKKDYTKINDKDVREFLRYSRRIPLIKPDLYSLAIFLVKNSPLQKQTIPSEAWKVLEHTNLKKLDIGRRIPEAITSPLESSGGGN